MLPLRPNALTARRALGGDGGAGGAAFGPNVVSARRSPSSEAKASSPMPIMEMPLDRTDDVEEDDEKFIYCLRTPPPRARSANIYMHKGAVRPG